MLEFAIFTFPDSVRMFLGAVIISKVEDSVSISFNYFHSAYSLKPTGCNKSLNIFLYLENSIEEDNK